MPLSRRALISRSIAAAVVFSAALAGCGLARPGGKDITMTITRGFGSATVGAATDANVSGSETVLDMLKRRFSGVQAHAVGKTTESVDSIDGVTAGTDGSAWSYYINGVMGSESAALTSLYAGDDVWWDLHDSTATNTIPAVVGSFPEPFLHGIAGKRLPTTLECASGMNAACAVLEKRLDGYGVPVAPQYIGTGSGPDTLGIVVGTWSELRAEVAAGLVDHGPSASGVYAKFANGGSELQLLNPHGTVVRTLTSGAGLVAATADSQSAPTWMITGTDQAGVLAAARAVTASALHDHFALAVQGGSDVPVPVEAAQ
jgi:hypothetical protein